MTPARPAASGRKSAAHAFRKRLISRKRAGPADTDGLLDSEKLALDDDGTRPQPLAGRTVIGRLTDSLGARGDVRGARGCTTGL